MASGIAGADIALGDLPGRETLNVAPHLLHLPFLLMWASSMLYAAWH